MRHPRQIMLVGGPMNGVCHELWIESNVMPEKIGLPIEGEPNAIAWYDIFHGEGLYICTLEDKDEE